LLRNVQPKAAGWNIPPAANILKISVI